MFRWWCSDCPGWLVAKSDWLDYQKLAADIYADLERAAVVTHDDRIKGVESGIERQIDVSIRTNVAGHEILIIVQAKDLGRPADVNVVGEFQAVIRDVRAAKGVLICSGGFTQAAVEYGRKLNIDLCTVHDAKHRKWAIDLRIPLLWVETAGDVTLEMELVNDRIYREPITFEPDAGKWLTSVDEGRNTVTIGQLLANEWNADPLNRTPKEHHKIELARPGMRIRLGDSFWCPAPSLRCTYTVERKGWLGTFSFSQCRGIFNRRTGTLRAKVTLTDKDLPLRRDESWTEVDDPDAAWEASVNMFRIEALVGPDSFTFSEMSLGSE
jgi:hypothetical protein